MRVWWGRVLGTDLVIDVEAGQVVSREMVNDGRLAFRQSRESRQPNR